MNKDGFTLVEVMVAIVLVSILALLAYPAYTEHVTRARRAEGRAALLELLQQQERHYALHSTYVAYTSQTKSGDSFGMKWHSAENPSRSSYELHASPCMGESLKTCIVVSAVPGTPKVNAAYRDPVCGTLSLTSTGVRTPAAEQCW